jgi:Transposase
VQPVDRARIALERPDGLLIERLLDAGLRVVAIHPNQVAAMRPRFSAAGGKNDSFDAFVLAELARTDSHRFCVLVPTATRPRRCGRSRALARSSSLTASCWPTSRARSWSASGPVPRTSVTGETVTRRLTPDQAQLYQQWIANRRQLDQLLARMEEVSNQAAEILLRDANVAHPRPVHTPARAR